ncbi:hypothetical protein FVER14953_21734 [Fusarium verticillioides]|nr:hypothetical protein FVER14953_21734 [Fusarium verticillioides]
MEPTDQEPSSSDVSSLPEALADLKRKADAGEAGVWTVLPLSNQDFTNPTTVRKSRPPFDDSTTIPLKV